MRPPKSDIRRRAHQFAGFAALFWLFFSIGALRAASIAAVYSEPSGLGPYLIGGTFGIWFLAFFGYLALHVRPRAKQEAGGYEVDDNGHLKMRV